MTDRIDWADVAAVGIAATEYMPWEDEDAGCGPVLAMLGTDGRGWHPLIDAIAAALREAFEAGQKEGQKERARFTPAEAADRMLIMRDAVEARDQEEIRALRRDLAARRAVDGWLLEREGMRAIGWIDGLLTALEFDDAGDQRFVAQAPSHPALAAALGLEVEDV